ncbi:MAG TPA: class I SAM-dependent methyltransferase [Armatimonadota bacterium]|jgi:ubiquinone/menaquinone biosynthesis C-methylase UbiE
MLNQWFWGCYATCYDTLTQLRPYQQMHADLIASLDLRPGMRVLDAGCGTGNLERTLAERGLDCQVTAIDFSPEMIRRAQVKCAGSGLQVSFQVVDLNGPLPFPAGSFDRIVSNNVLYALRDPVAVLDQFAHVLTPTGRMAHAIPLQGFSMHAVLQEHLQHLQGLQKLSLLRIVPQLLVVALYNLTIFRQVDDGQYTFFTQEEALGLTQRQGWRGHLGRTYAQQDWLIALERN